MHDDLNGVTLARVQAWGDERNAAGIAPKTINDTDFSALRAVFGWGAKRGWLSFNPAEGAKIEGRGKTKTRERYFSETEIRTILTTAQAVTGSGREDPKTTEAKRWVPWLCAYSGARVSEIIQLRKHDVRQEGPVWVMRLTPDAGSVKTNDFRDVPIHGHLVELGFITFVDLATDGPLFCNIGDDGTTTGPASGVYKRVRDLVRSVVTDPTVQPSHAWRYTFKTRGFEEGIDRLALDAICGHGSKSQGEEYTKVTLKKRIEAMVSFPRYEISI
jgi:integrase